jgi:hypothetical protein
MDWIARMANLGLSATLVAVDVEADAAGALLEIGTTVTRLRTDE